jgi:WD40 repeat protein/tRNA A-37 threonylcarbamoyl transferase component Bud32
MRVAKRGPIVSAPVDDDAARSAPEKSSSQTFDDSPAGGRAARPEGMVLEERRGQYTRLDELGRGGQSVVYRARDESVGREVALKEMAAARPGAPASLSTAAARARFLREARLTAQLEHPGIVAVHELAQRSDGTLVCAQKLVRGETLKARLLRCASLRERLQLLPHVIDACHAVAYAHSRGVVHRDLKPSNIMVGAFGETVVVDWGLAKRVGEADPPDAPAPAASPSEAWLTLAGEALGTPAYMSPEQARGDLAAIDERSDVFSLGVMLYELLAGRRPFEGATAKDVIDRVLAGNFPPLREVCPEAPSELAAVAERALRPERGERYPGAAELARELSEWRAGGRVQAYEYRSLELLQRFVARNRALSAAVAAAMALAIGFSIFVARQLRSTRTSLAAAFIDKAQAAEKDLDWGSGAAYYAASLAQRDSLRARWGVALDAQRMARRTTRALERTEAAAVAFAADGRAVLVRTPGSGAVIAEDAESGRKLWQATLPSAVNSFRPGGGIVAAFYQITERWRAYDLTTGQRVADGPEEDSSPCLGAPGAPRALWRVVPGGERLEAIRSPAPVVLAETRGSTQGKCVVSRDGTRLAAYIAEESSTVVWDLTTLQPILRKQGRASVPTFTRHGLAVPAQSSTDLLGGPEGDFSIPHGIADSGFAWLAGAGHFIARTRAPDHLELMDLVERRMTATLPIPDYPALADDGSRLAVVVKVGPEVVVSWSFPPPDSLLRSADPGEGQVAFSSDGSRFATASDSLGALSPIEVWTREGRLVGALAVPRLPTTRFNLSPDGSRLTVISTANLAAVWDVASSARLLEFACSECFSGVVPSSDGSLVLATSVRHEVALWDVARRERRWQVPLKGYVSSVTALSDDGTLAARVGDNYPLVIAAAASGAEQARIPVEDDIPKAIAFSHDGKRIAVVTGRVAVWTVDGSPLWSIPRPLKAYVPKVLWSPDDSRLILDDDQASILDSSSGELLARVDPDTRTPQPRSFVSPDLRYVVKRGRTSWTLHSLPAPEEGPPARVLATILEQTGLELKGAELSPAAARERR